MKLFVFRNSTIEPFFANYDATFSGYEDISVIPDVADIYIWFYTLPVEYQQKIIIEKINEIKKKLSFVQKKIPGPKPFYIFSLHRIYSFTIETNEHAVRESIEDFNRSLYELEKDHLNVKIIQFQSFTSQYPGRQLIDWKYYFLSGMTLNPKFAADFNNWFENQLKAIQMKRKKCLVLDLDNTLWGGILGEDGIYGIQAGGDYPGNAYLELQRSILELQKTGIILAVLSKNNESDVLEAWERNSGILIRKEHLAIYRINWKNKVENFQEIIKELNIGPESIVYIDDNPGERELVKLFFPEIEVPEFPDHPYMLPDFIETLTGEFFRVYRLTSEDLVKTRQYQENAVRKEFQSDFNDYSDYLRYLKIEMDIQPADPSTISRIAQLTQKTNQFNLTTKGYTEADINKFIQNGFWIYTMNVSDRFGSNGVTGTIILSIDYRRNSAEIDTFLVSCRVLGKGIENAFMNFVLNKLKDNGLTLVESTYVKTAKNEQVADFYDNQGFTCEQIIQVENMEIKKYSIDISDKTLEIQSYITITENGK